MGGKASDTVGGYRPLHYNGQIRNTRFLYGVIINSDFIQVMVALVGSILAFGTIFFSVGDCLRWTAHGASLVHRRRWLQYTSSAIPAVIALPTAANQPTSLTPQQEEEARIQRKLAAQRAAGAKDGKKSFSKDLADERAKEKARKTKSKQEQREELCELLGRGC